MSKDVALFNNFFNDLPSLNSWEDSFFGKGFPSEFSKIMNGKCDFEETDDEYKIDLELPGVKKEEVSIDLKNDVLNISWKRTRESKKGLLKKKNYERSEGSFSRSFHVQGVDSEKVDASLKDGVLSITLKKNDSEKAKQIQIK